jgi:thioredoxin-disulfide reductase
MYDVIIIGAGAAGITAAIYAARANLKFEIISKDIGGLTLWSSDIENYTGFHNLNGMQLVEKFQEHMADYNIDVKEESVIKVEKKNNNFIVKTESREYETKTVIVCSGSSPRKLNVPGADKFEGKGLAYCATCDSPLFAGKEVAVIGGGDAALDAANTLLQAVKKVTIINVNPELTGKDKALVDKVLKSGKVEVINNANTKEILGDKFVNGIKYEQGKKEKKIKVEGIFVEIGHIRNVDFVKDLVKLNDKNEILTDKAGATSVPGIFAAGDVTNLPGKQSIIAAGDGSRALLSAFAYLSKKM